MRRPGGSVGVGGVGVGEGGGCAGGDRPEQEPQRPAVAAPAVDPDDDDEVSSSDNGDSDDSASGGQEPDRASGSGSAVGAPSDAAHTPLLRAAGEASASASAAAAAVAVAEAAGGSPAKVSLREDEGHGSRQKEEKDAQLERCNSHEASPPSGGAGAGGEGGGDGGGAAGSAAPGSGPGPATPGAAGQGATPRATAAPRDPAAPCALEKVLEQLGILPHRGGEAAAAAEMENKYRAVALAARADSQTLSLRMERQARLREQAERNVAAEADELARALHRLNYLCKEAESVELLGAARDQIHFLLRASKYVAATAETMGALRLEARMAGWMEASLSYADSLKLQLETVRSEHEELRRILTESGASLDSNSPQGSSTRRPLSSKLQLTSPRRASIAVPTRPTSVSPGTGIKDQGRLSLAFIPGSTVQSPTVLRSGRRPLSSASSDTTVGASGADSAAPSPSIVPEDFQPLLEDAMQTPLEEDIVDHGGSEESIPHRNSHPRLSTVGLPDPECEVLSVPHVRRRESSAVSAIATLCSPNTATVQTARSLYRASAAELLDHIWPPDFLMMAQHARWLLVRLLVLAAVWCVVQAFMSPADAHMQYTTPFSTSETHDTGIP